MTIVEFFYEIISPFSRIQYELLIRQQSHWKSMQLKMTPVLIRKIFEAADNLPPGMNPTKARYLNYDLKMLSQYSKIPFAIPDDFMQIAIEKGTKLTQQFLTAIQDDLTVDEYHRLVGQMFLYFFHPNEHKNVGEISIMKQVALDMGLPKEKVEKAIKDMETEQVINKLQKNTDMAIELGAFGLPVTLVHSEKPKWVFGCDRNHILGELLGEKEPPLLRLQK